MPLTIYALDEFFSDNISELTENNMPELENLENEKPIQTFVLRTIFMGEHVKRDKRSLVYYYLRRAQLAIFFYREASIHLTDFLRTKTHGITPYLLALAKVELVISYLYQILNLEKRIADEPLFEKGDNSIYERLNRCYNIIKHFEMSNIPADLKQSTYLTNKAFNANNVSITYAEIQELIVQKASFANKIASGIKDD